MGKYPKTDNYDENGFAPPLEEGIYTVKLNKIIEKDDKDQYLADKNGHRLERFEFTVKDHSENLLFDRFCFNEESPWANQYLGRFKQFLTAVDIDTDSEGNTSDLIGKSCNVRVKNRTYEGKVYNNINEYLPSDDTFSDDTNNPEDDLPF
jgi:hypothetical protein